jgi:hypothetical protein
MNIDEGIARATQLAKQGNNRQAREIIRNILSIDRKNESAWLLFSRVAEKQSHEILCLNNVLKINPNNEYAINRLQIINNANEINQNHNNRILGSSLQLLKKISYIFIAVILVCIISGLLFLNKSSAAVPTNTQQPKPLNTPLPPQISCDKQTVNSWIKLTTNRLTIIDKTLEETGNLQNPTSSDFVPYAEAAREKYLEQLAQYTPECLNGIQQIATEELRLLWKGMEALSNGDIENATIYLNKLVDLSYEVDRAVQEIENNQ